jgi:transcriptional regulator with XRE-family HTH domain
LQELKRLRKDKNWSQARLAKESGVDRATINQAEGGRRSPTIETLEKLALAMETEVADFFPKNLEPSGPRSLGWALSASEEEFRGWIKSASSLLLHKLWILIGGYAAELEIGDEHRFVVGRAQAAIDEYFRRNPPSAVRPRKGKREVETARERAANG